MSNAVIVFTVAAISTVLWVISLFVRRKNSKLGVILSWTAMILMAISIILYQVLKDK